MKNLFKCSQTSALIVFVITISACSPTITMVNTSCAGYKSPEFVRNDIKNKGIGIMPVLGGDEKEQYRRPMGDAIFTEFQYSFGNQVKSSRDVIEVLNEHNISEDYSRAINNYTISGIIPKEIVQNLGNALQVNYLLYTRLLSSREYAQIYTGTYSSTTVNIDELYVQTQVWDVNIGDVVWEGKGGVAKLPANQTDVITETAKGLANVVGKEQNQGPCQETSELFNAIQAATINTYLAAGGISFVITLLLLGGMGF